MGKKKKEAPGIVWWGKASAIKSLTDVRAAWGTDKFLEGLQTADGLTEQIILKVSTKTKIPQFLRLFQDLRRKKMASWDLLLIKLDWED